MFSSFEYPKSGVHFLCFDQNDPEMDIIEMIWRMHEDLLLKVDNEKASTLRLIIRQNFLGPVFIVWGYSSQNKKTSLNILFSNEEDLAKSLLCI